MNFKVSKKEKYASVTVSVEKLDGTISPGLKSELVLLNSEGVKNLIVDMSMVKYCDSSGLSAILVGNRLCKNSGGMLVVCGLQPTVKKLVSISQLDSILNLTPTFNEAEDFLFMNEIENDLNN